MTQASELSSRLSARAEAVCRRYLPHGRREGRYWLVGDVHDTPGRSLYVRLTGDASGQSATGKWTDAATGEHGDLLDLIAASRGLGSVRETLDEARAFLGERASPPATDKSDFDPVASARRLFHAARPIAGTLGEGYLRSRGIEGPGGCEALRFHPRCFYRPERDEPATDHEHWPAIVARITDVEGAFTGVHRTWLASSGEAKAPVASPRRAMGHLRGHGVRFGVARDVLAAGEGLETMLSLRSVLPDLPLVATLSASHLASLILPPTLRRLYIARDNDAVGARAADRLGDRAREAGIEVVTLTPTSGDFNDDLRRLEASAMAAAIRVQLAPEDVECFWRTGDGVEGGEHSSRLVGSIVG